ncbi:MAG: DMT family transporter [Rhodospirillaceae bacterium]|jgi:drug/metabolite transporter (DMT)-like permease|nr:DMT family transporter [Rhodospirillaceae bacterium]MBT5458275.1 DMT family transporter [Rhodospirillaceae bacterium]
MTDIESDGLSPGWKAIASALFIFFWASGFIAAKFGLPYAEPFTFLTLRFLVALLILIPLSMIWRATWPRPPRTFGHVVVAGLMVGTAYLIGVFYAVYLGISTGVIALIVGLQPLITGSLAAPVLGEHVSTKQWVGLALGFIGLGLVVAEKVNFASGEAWGAALGLLALIGITLGTLYQKKFCSGVDIRASVTIQNAVSLVVIAPLAFTFETMEVQWTGEFYFALLWSAIGLSVIAIALYYFLVRRGAAAEVSSLIYLSPPTTALMGWLMFDETFAALALAGMAIAVAGVALANR